MQCITDINDPRISHFRSLRFTPSSHTEENLLIAESEKIVLSLLESDLQIISIFALPEFFEQFQSAIDSKVSSDQQYTADKEMMNQIVGLRLHSGCMAMAKQPPAATLPELSSRIIALNGIINAENVGAIIRNAAAFGIDSVIVDSSTASPFLRRSVRVSMGASFWQKVYFSDKLSDTLLELKHNMSYSIVSAELTPSSININEFVFPQRCVVIFGNEGDGIAPNILEISDAIVAIPIEPRVASLNVAASSAIFLEKMR